MGIFISTPAAIAWDKGRVEVFGLWADRAMYTKTNSGDSWTSSWERLGAFADAGTVVRRSRGSRPGTAPPGPPLVARTTGGARLRPGAPVAVTARGRVLAWARAGTPAA